MLCSVFAPLSLFRCSAQEPDSRAIYQAAIRSVEKAYNVTPGSRMEAKCFADAMLVARARMRIKQASDQALPWKAVEGLPNLETELGIVPGPNDTILQRRAVATRRAQLPTGNTTQAIIKALTDLLGSGFIEYRPTKASEAVLDPATLGAQPMNLQRPGVPRKIIQCTSPISLLTPIVQTFNYVPLANTPLLIAGDIVVVDPDRSGQAERFTVLSAATVSGLQQASAKFIKAHDVGSIGTTQPMPLWQSTKRHSLVIVTPAVATNPVLKAQIHLEMRRRVRCVSTWDIVESADGGATTLPFALGTPCMGFSTLPSMGLP